MHHTIPIPYSIVLWPVTHAMHSGNLISRALNRRQDTGDRIVTLATVIKGPTKDPACDHCRPLIPNCWAASNCCNFYWHFYFPPMTSTSFPLTMLQLLLFLFSVPQLHFFSAHLWSLPVADGPLLSFLFMGMT